MPGYIRIHEEVFDLLDKYCNVKVRPAELPLVMDRIIRPWVTKGAAAWARQPNLIPKLEPIPEGKLTTVPMNTDHALWFRQALGKLEKKFDITLNPDEVATFLTRMFCKTYEIKEKNKYKPWMTGGGIRKM